MIQTLKSFWKEFRNWHKKLIHHILTIIKTKFSCRYTYKVVFVDRYSKLVVIYRGQDVVYRFIDTMLGDRIYCREVIEKHFNRSLVMKEDDEKDFGESNKCWICGRLYAEKDTRVRDHDHVTSKWRCSAQKSCNVNFKLSKKIAVLFHNLRRYNSHLIIQRIGRFYDIENIQFIWFW